jgi:hypothetical protein
MFDPTEGCAEDDYEEAKRWLYRTLHLQEESEENWVALNEDPARAKEFLEFYLQHPELKGWRRNLLADVIVDSLLKLIEPDLEDEDPPTIKDAEAIGLLGRMVHDPMLLYFLEPNLQQGPVPKGPEPFHNRPYSLLRQALALEPSIVPATIWLEQTLNLNDSGRLEENRDASRAFEFLEFYRAHPELKGPGQWYLADLVAESMVDHIQRSSPGVATERTAAMTYEEAEALLRDLVRDESLRIALSGLKDGGSKWVTDRTRLLLERVLADEPPQSPQE